VEAPQQGDEGAPTKRSTRSWCRDQAAGQPRRDFGFHFIPRQQQKLAQYVFWFRQEKRLSVYLLNIADLAAQGQLRIHGVTLGTVNMSPSVREAVKTLFPAAALGTPLASFEAPASGWVAQAPALPTSVSPEMLDNAYRNTITPPIALGLSSFFGLLNLAQGLGLCVLLLLRRQGHPNWAAGLRKHLLALTAAMILGLTAVHHDDFIDSPGYALHLSPYMWQHNAVLATFIAWDLRAEPAWYTLSDWAHHQLLRGFSFTKL
jgi:hypothetical protein